MDSTTSPSRQDMITALEQLDKRLLWLSSWMIHNANHLRKQRVGLKVGGHQPSCASLTANLAAPYVHALRPQAKLADTTHAWPVLHACHSLISNQTLDTLQRYHGLE